MIKSKRSLTPLFCFDINVERDFNLIPKFQLQRTPKENINLYFDFLFFTGNVYVYLDKDHWY